MLSEASIDYSAGKTALHLGRSQVNLDNQRFIGTVGWRQVERSYDTVYAANSDVENLSILAAYVYGFQGVGAGATAETNSILLNVKYKVADALTVTAYDYMIASLSDTLGLALTGKIDAGAKLTYRAEYAQQSNPTMEYRVKDVKADATYYNLDFGANISGFLVGLNYEVLGGQDKDDLTGTSEFQTPLATKHKFNGWADVFLTTATEGLVDLNLRGGYQFDTAGKIIGIYHMFGAAADGTNGRKDGKDIKSGDAYGQEFDIAYSAKIPGAPGLKGLLKGAMYMGDDTTTEGAKDKTMVWVQLDYKFSI